LLCAAADSTKVNRKFLVSEREVHDWHVHKDSKGGPTMAGSPGYRIYIADDGRYSLILCAGSKRTQNEDIKMAKRYWNDYKARR
jgi:hypothetical protein